MSYYYPYYSYSLPHVDTLLLSRQKALLGALESLLKSLLQELLPKLPSEDPESKLKSPLKLPLDVPESRRKLLLSVSPLKMPSGDPD